MKVVGALALGARTPAEVADAAGLDVREATAALRRLEAGGLVATERGVVRLREERFKEAARAETPPPPSDEELSADAETAAVLRIFAPDGRITGMPTSRDKRRLLLGHVARVLEPGVRYRESEVNALLRAWHDDHAMLRRYLYDEGFVDRTGEEYWRIGGYVDTEPPRPEPERRATRVAAYGLLERDGEVLLTLLGPSPHTHSGRWTLPGGGVDHGERPADAVVREVYEETGHRVRIVGLLDVDAERLAYDRDGRPVVEHPVRVFYRLEVTGGELGVVEVGGSTVEVAWWPRRALPESMTPYARDAVERFTGR